MKRAKELRELAAEVNSAGPGWPEGPDFRNIDRGNIVVEGHTWESARKLAALVLEVIEEPCEMCNGSRQIPDLFHTGVYPCPECTPEMRPT